MNLKNKFCPKCGKEAKELINGLCPLCYYKNSKVNIPRELVITICKKCHSVISRGKCIKVDSWKHYLSDILFKKIKVPKGMNLENVKIIDTGEDGKIRLWLSINDDVFTESASIPIIIKEKICSNCNIKKNRQWNSKIQLRADEKTVNKIIKSLPRDYVTKVKPISNGVDIFFSDKDKGKSIARKIKIEYNLKSKSSFEQRGWDRLKNTSHKLPVILLKKD